MSAGFYAPRFDIRVSGVRLAADISTQVTHVAYDSNLDVADMFSVSLRNDANTFTDSPLFELGKDVEIHLGYGNDLKPMMLAEVTSIQPSFPESGAPTLTISGYDKSYRLRHNQPDRSEFRYMTDSAIAAQIALEAGLIPIVDPSPFFHKRLAQTGSDMAFLKTLARENFFDVYVHWDKLYFQFPRPQTEAYVLEWGKNLSSFNPRLSSAGVTGLQVVRGYNEELAEAIVGIAMVADLDVDSLIERLGSTALDGLMRLGRRVIRRQPVGSMVDAAGVARAILQEILEGLYEASGTCIGIPDLRAGSFVRIQGVGKRFSGLYRLKKATHTVDDSGYRTAFEVTQRAGSNLLQLIRKSVTEPPPDGQEPYYGVAVGRVMNNADTEGLGRVTLSLPWFSDTNETEWVSCAVPMSGLGAGTYFVPEVGEQVLVAFEHGDISKPFVIGSLWSAKRPAPAKNADKRNDIRLIKSRAGHTITFDDGAAPKVVIEDAGGNKITLSNTGIDLAAAQNKDITLSARNVRVTVSGTMDVS
jgi:phage protein D/phage baseplate assembly protein gpV